MSQTIWFFDKPTLRYCVVHQATSFRYDNGRGLTCDARDSDKECDEKCWLDFELVPDDERDGEALDQDMSPVAVVEEYGEALNRWINCYSCEMNRRETELVEWGGKLLCEDCAEGTDETDEGDEEE